MPRRLCALLAALLAAAGPAACAGSRAGAHGAGAPAASDEAAGASSGGAAGPGARAAATAGDKKKEDPLFPERKVGWAHADRQTRERAAALAAEYLPFLDRARTPRRAVAALVELYRAAGATPLEGTLSAGGRAYWIAPGGDAALLLLAGRGGAAAGIRAVVAAVDGPRIELKQVPLYRHDRLTMLETALYGDITLESWLVRPLALHVRVARPSAPARELVVGEAPGDPVLVIPDLLIHLSDKVQARAPVDTPERMDALAAMSGRAVTAALRARGIAPADLATAEAYLVPAEHAVLAGVDRAMVAGYAQSELAPAWAATRALAAAEPGEASAAVLLISRSQARWSGSSGSAFVRLALGRAQAALAGGHEADLLDSQRARSRSALLVATAPGGAPGRGLVVSPRSDDAMPAALRAVLDRFDAAGVPVQTGERGRGLARQLGRLDVDAVEMGLAVQGRGQPFELLSTLDLHHAVLAFSSWFK